MYFIANYTNRWNGLTKQTVAKLTTRSKPFTFFQPGNAFEQLAGTLAFKRSMQQPSCLHLRQSPQFIFLRCFHLLQLLTDNCLFECVS